MVIPHPRTPCRVIRLWQINEWSSINILYAILVLKYCVIASIITCMMRQMLRWRVLQRNYDCYGVLFGIQNEWIRAILSYSINEKRCVIWWEWQLFYCDSISRHSFIEQRKDLVLCFVCFYSRLNIIYPHIKMLNYTYLGKH